MRSNITYSLHQHTPHWGVQKGKVTWVGQGEKMWREKRQMNMQEKEPKWIWSSKPNDLRNFMFEFEIVTLVSFCSFSFLRGRRDEILARYMLHSFTC